MKKNSVSKQLSALLLAVLLTVSLAACSVVKTPQGTGGAVVKDGDTIGEGASTFTVEVVDEKGEKITFTVKSDTETKTDPAEPVMVGEVLQKLGVLEGEEGPYGLYIKGVNGRTADYETDKLYWAFYVDGAYAMEGADMTEVKAGAVYGFRLES
ncbi:MAG: DUF4430 domain-containing protein [Ruminococcaceae bacterium]|nr:DUF4430 domain-containing protein [Oscillospiraceae bacterium]